MDITDLTLDPSGQDNIKTDSNDSDDQAQLVQGEDDEGNLVVNSQGTISFDPSGQYHFRADTGQGQVTYRVVQVAQGEDGQTQIVANPQIVQTDDGIQVLNTGALPSNPQSSPVHLDAPEDLSIKPPDPKVIQSPFSNGGSSPNDPLTSDGRFTYISAGAGDVATGSGVTAAAAAASQGDVGQAALGQTTLGQVGTAGGGQFYVMMSPQDVLQAAGPRVIAPRSGPPRVDGNRSSRDERRRASHNEVERRRRDKMNEWIVHLSKMVPDCAQDNNKMIKSKGGILAKACEYISELRAANTQMSEAIKEAEKLSVDNELLRSQVEELKQENNLLHSQLQQHGIVIASHDDAENR